MQRWDTVAIVGVGLIGGSIGLALRGPRLARRVIGIGRSHKSLDAALACGCVDETTTSIAIGVAEADLVVACTPVEMIPGHVIEAISHCPEKCLLTDAGSTKAEIVAKVEAGLSARSRRGLRFVGSHPIAGGEKNGPDAARGDLFAGRIAVLTPTERTDPATTAAFEEFWRSLGAIVMQMGPDEHDAALAATSHLPHLVASALAAATPEDVLRMTGSGWQDTTRVAAGDVELWRQILLANRGHTLKALADFERVLAQFRAALEFDDKGRLAALLTEGKRRRDALGS